MTFDVAEANNNDAFISDVEGWDVAILSRYRRESSGVGCEEHLPHLLTDDQWQQLVNQVAAVPELIVTLRRMLTTPADGDHYYEGIRADAQKEARALLARIDGRAA